MSVIEIFASILIAIAIIKIIIFIYKPELWFDFLERLYSAPMVISIIGAICSIVVLYFLLKSGFTVIDILAISLFVGLLMVTGFANYADEIIGWVREQDFNLMIKRLWLYSLAWVLLVIWGIRELFLLYK